MEVGHRDLIPETRWYELFRATGGVELAEIRFVVEEESEGSAFAENVKRQSLLRWFPTDEEKFKPLVEKSRGSKQGGIVINGDGNQTVPSQRGLHPRDLGKGKAVVVAPPPKGSVFSSFTKGESSQAGKVNGSRMGPKRFGDTGRSGLNNNGGGVLINQKVYPRQGNAGDKSGSGMLEEVNSKIADGKVMVGRNKGKVSTLSLAESTVISSEVLTGNEAVGNEVVGNSFGVVSKSGDEIVERPITGEKKSEELVEMVKASDGNPIGIVKEVRGAQATNVKKVNGKHSGQATEVMGKEIVGLQSGAMNEDIGKQPKVVGKPAGKVQKAIAKQSDVMEEVLNKQTKTVKEVSGRSLGVVMAASGSGFVGGG